LNAAASAIKEVTAAEKNRAIDAGRGGRVLPIGRIGVGGADFSDPLRRELMPSPPAPPVFPLVGPLRPPPLTPDAELANLKAVAAAMGAGATESLKLDIAQRELDDAIKRLGSTSEKTLMSLVQQNLAQMALTVTSQKTVIAAKEQLGVARDEDIINVSLADTRLRLAVAGITDAKAIATATDIAKRSAQDRINAQNALRDPMKQVTDGITMQVAQMRIEAETLGMTTGQAGAYKLVEDEIVKAQIANKPLTEDRIAALRKESLELGRVTDRMADLKQVNDLAGTFASGFATDISHGVKAIDALHNALTRLADSLIDMAARRLVAQALGSLFGSFMGSLGSGGPGTMTGAEWVAAGKAHTGGIAGQLTDIGYVHPAYFDHAPRYHGGIDYAGGEMPAILKRGEEVGWPAQLARKYGGGGNAAPQVVITNHVDASGADPAAVSRLLKGLEEVNKSIERRAVAALAQHRQREG
jgi:hypothetical protein